jgi:hypothetical protein
MTRRRVTKLATLNQLDQRTSAAKQARALMADIESDLGGADELTAAERQLVQRSAVTGAILESMEAEWLASGQIDAATYIALGNAQRRYLETLGIERRARPVQSLEQYLASKERS